MRDSTAIFLLTLILALDIGCQLHVPALCSQGKSYGPIE